MAKKKSKFDWRFLFLLPLPLLWALGDQLGYLKVLENKMLDLRFRFRGDIASPVKLMYVDLDTRAIQFMGEKPWNRARYGDAAQLLLERGGAKGVGFDIVFSAMGHSELLSKEVAEKGNFAFGKVTHKHPEVILGAQYTGGESSTTAGQRLFPILRLGFSDRAKNSPPELPQYPISGATTRTKWGTIGFIDVDEDYSGDGIPRWAPLFAESATTDFWAMSVQLACLELGVPPDSVRRNGDFVDIVGKDGTILRHIPVTEKQLLEVNWFSTWESPIYNPRVSLADVLIYGAQFQSDKPEEVEEAQKFFKIFVGAIILVGPTDSLLQDLAPSPLNLQPVPKVGVHGNLVKTIIAEKYLTHMPKWVMWVAVLLFTGTVSALAVIGGNRGLVMKIAALGLLGGYFYAALEIFAQLHLVLPMTAPLGSALSTSFIGIMWQLILEEKQKGRIKDMFGTYLAPELVNQMVESESDPQLGGHKDVITAYFSDIQRFSTFSELLTPEKLVELMNEYLTVCTDIVQEEKGTLDKYIGDAVVAIFGAPLPVPDHAYRACVATQRVQQRIGELRTKWRSEGSKWHPVVFNLRARLGLNTGEAIIGNMGSRSRFSYTMMGDNVNLAARMESGAKSLGVFTMVTEATKLACEQHGGDHVVFRYLDRIVVKGRSQPVPVFEILGLKESVSQQTRDCIAIFAQGTERYLAQDWDGALQLFAKSAELEPNQQSEALAVDSNPSTIFIERCREMKADPPGPNWDGSFVMKEK